MYTKLVQSSLEVPFLLKLFCSSYVSNAKMTTLSALYTTGKLEQTSWWDLQLSSPCVSYIYPGTLFFVSRNAFLKEILYWFSHWESRIRTTNQKSSTNAVSGLLLLGFITVVSVDKMMKIELTPRSESQTSLLKGRNILNMWTSRTYIKVKRNITLPVWKSKIFEIVKYLSDSKLKTRHLVEFIWDGSRVIPEMNFT